MNGISNKLNDVLSIIHIFIRRLQTNKVSIQAAALSYYSLISLGPIISLSILVFSFILKNEPEALATTIITKTISFIAPPVAEFEKINTLNESSTSINPELLNLVSQLVQSAKSGTAGIIGTLILIAVCIQLIITIEKALNTIWGIYQGRPFIQRILAYWAFLSLGIMILIGLWVLLSNHSYFYQIPYIGDYSKNISKQTIYCLLFLLMTVGLSLFYRYMPYTQVFWKTAIVGGIFASSLLSLNNYLSFLYIQNAIQTKSLYGSIGIIPILMFGLFIFWFIILSGGQMSYATQNAKSIRNTIDLHSIHYQTQELLNLSIFLMLARPFYNQKAIPSTIELSQQSKLPLHVVNQSLTQLHQCKLITRIQQDSFDPNSIYYQPSMSLECINLLDIKKALTIDHQKINHTHTHAFKDPILKIYQSCAQNTHTNKKLKIPLSCFLNNKK